MKAIVTFLLATSLAITSAMGQQFEGIATYKTSMTMDLKESVGKNSAINDEMMKQIQAQLSEQFQKEFTLSFTKDESLYKEVEKLDKPKPQMDGITINVTGDSDLLYRNLKEQHYVRESEIMGKQFLIQDNIEKNDWKLGKETKNIGEYTCFKATYTKEVDEETWNSETKKFDQTKEEKTTTIWYTLDVPIQHGPSEFWGLPGLVLEVNDGQRTILCSKIVMNPKGGVTIEAPTKGKKVNQEEFDKIEEKKQKEMMERFQGSSSEGDGVIMKVIRN